MLFKLSLLLPLVAASASGKRGLIYIPNANTPQDDSIWVQGGSDLTWYYNYQSTPSSAYSQLPQSQFEFVPMMWGIQNNNPSDTSFLGTVQGLIDGGTPISNVLGFNEPDGALNTGGSAISPDDAATAWIANLIPLQNQGVRIGMPAVTGSPAGLDWLKAFVGACNSQIGGECRFDFLPVHWYDNFDGLQSHINEAFNTFNVSIWLTEFAYAWQDYGTTMEFFNQSTSWMDGVDYVERYSYFGAFRSSASNVGPEVTFLNNAGQLTDIGSWYLGGGDTGVDPSSG